MAYERRSFAGAAADTTLAAPIGAGDTSLSITASTNWPSGSGGDFFVVIDRGTANEEKVRIDTRSSTTLTVAASGRGADGTAAVSHASGASIALCVTAVDLDEANAHVSNSIADPHPVYLNEARHDIEARHTFGAALGTPGTPAAIGTTASTGSGDNPAREDHVHAIGTGAINNISQITSGVQNSLGGARGVKGYALVETGSQGITGGAGATDVSGLTGITFTAEAGRLYKVSAGIGLNSFAASSGSLTLTLVRSGGTGAGTLRSVTDQYTSGGTSRDLDAVVIDVPGAASVTYKAQFGAAMNCTISKSSASPAFLVVEDIGAA